MKHATLIDGLDFAGERRSEIRAPTILRYTGPEFMASFLADLGQPDWRDRLEAAAQIEKRGGLPLLDQHVHLGFAIALVDVACIVPGFPRLDMAKVESAGLVVRRETAVTEAWFRAPDGRALGWQALPTGALAADTRWEPDGTRRRTKLVGRNPALGRLDALAGDEGGVSEEVHPLFPIPQDLAAKLGRTLYFGVVPTTSLDEVPVQSPAPPFRRSDVADRAPELLRPDRQAANLPPTGAVITQAEARAPALSASPTGVETLMSALTRLGQEYGAFTGESYAHAFRAELAAIPVAGVAQADLLAFLENAFRVLVERSASATSVTTPSSWPAIGQAKFDALVATAEAAMAARWARLQPAVKRFGPIGETYHLRCFLRIDDCPGCPPRTVWSPLSTRFRIRPWHESGDRPPVLIELPDLTPEAMAALKPNVAVKVPPSIQQFMDKLNLGDLIDGKASKTSLGFGMICGFSIPIITICAFIVLQIFLSLLNIVFFWIAFIRICIPFPVITEEEG